jgi:hypothetical protein
LALAHNVEGIALRETSRLQRALKNVAGNHFSINGELVGLAVDLALDDNGLS